MEICDIGIRGFEDTLAFQLEMLKKRIDGDIPDTLIIVEHPSVITLGRRSLEENIIDRAYFEGKNIPIVLTGRGGEVTCHSPGQIVCYPIIDLKNIGKDIAGYIDFLEVTVSAALNEIGVNAGRVDGKRGVWTQGKKIAFIGIAIKKWVTYHGVAVNVNNSLEPFLKIHPCGHKEIEVTSVMQQLGKTTDINGVKEALAEKFISGIEGTVGIKQKQGVSA